MHKRLPKRIQAFASLLENITGNLFALLSLTSAQPLLGHSLAAASCPQVTHDTISNISKPADTITNLGKRSGVPHMTPLLTWVSHLVVTNTILKTTSSDTSSMSLPTCVPWICKKLSHTCTHSFLTSRISWQMACSSCWEFDVRLI